MMPVRPMPALQCTTTTWSMPPLSQLCALWQKAKMRCRGGQLWSSNGKHADLFRQSKRASENTRGQPVSAGRVSQANACASRHCPVPCTLCSRIQAGVWPDT